MFIHPTAPCVDCGKPIDNGHWYYGTGRAGGKDGYHHSTCGDPLGIEAAVAAERERCAKIAENPGFIQARDTEWDDGVNYAKTFIAAVIRGFQ